MKIRMRMLILCGLIGLGLMAFTSGIAAEGESMVKTDAEVAAELKLLLGDGSGVTAEYLAKGSKRYQAAIISLRLQGKLDEAMAYQDTANNFSDANLLSANNQAILAYLKNNPELGWLGTGNNTFDPLSSISSQQLYKVLLEVLGYRQGTDFEYTATEQFAANKGLVQIMGTATLTNSHIATALVEALSTNTTNEVSLFTALQSNNVIAADASSPVGKRISIKNHLELGPYLADHEGNTLYTFTKDSVNMDACQGNCLVNWPSYGNIEGSIPSSLNKDDFGMITRSDGSRQAAYKNFPLYYFIQDKEHGDLKGQGLNQVWYLVNPAEFDGTTVSKVKTYNIDMKEFSFGATLTVESGSKIVFTNYDDMQHNAVAVNGSFSTPLLAKGESHSITLSEAGAYDYYCEPHKSFMTGKIIVQ